MMAGFMGYFGGRKDPKQTTRDAIVGLRQQLGMLEKKEEYLIKKMEEELKKAKSNAVSNKAGMDDHVNEMAQVKMLKAVLQWPRRLYGERRPWRLNSIG